MKDGGVWFEYFNLLHMFSVLCTIESKTIELEE